MSVIDDDLVTRFETERSRLLAIAGRILGSPTGADDVVQEAWLRLAGTFGSAGSAGSASTPDNVAAWLTTVVTRLCLDQLRARRHAEPTDELPEQPDPAAGPEADAVLAECDGLDGLKDGMINAYRACRFTPRSLVCKAKMSSPDCLSPAQAEALIQVFGGARDSRGRSLYGTYPFDTGIAAPVWIPMHIGTSATEVPNSADAVLGGNTLRYYAMTPPDPGCALPATLTR